MTESSEVPKIKAAAMAASVLVSLGMTAGLSYLGVAGTLSGVVASAALTGTVTAYAEHWLRHGGHAVRKAAKAGASKPQQAMAWALTALVLFAGVLTLTEKAFGKPLSDVVQGHRGSGLTLSGGGGTPVTPRPSYGHVVPLPTPSTTLISVPSGSVPVTVSPLSSSPAASSVSPTAPATSAPPVLPSPASSSQLAPAPPVTAVPVQSASP